MSENKLDVSTCLSMVSNYAYYEDLEYGLDKIAIFKKYEDIEKEFLIGKDIVKADLYIAEIVGKLSFSTANMVLEELKLMKAHPQYEKVLMPACKMEIVKRALIRLCRNGIARCFSYKTKKGITVQMYCLSETGLHLVKKVLYSKLKTEETMLSLEPVEEAFRRLVSSYCVQLIRRRYKISKINYGTRVYIPTQGRKYIYGQCEYMSEDGKRNILIVEPIYYKTNEQIVPKERVEEHNKERIEILNAYISYLKNDEPNLDVKVIFIFENKAGLQKSANLALSNLEIVTSTATNEVRYQMEAGLPCTYTEKEVYGIRNICFTSEPLLYNLEGNEFMGVGSVEEGKIKYTMQYQIKK